MTPEEVKDKAEKAAELAGDALHRTQETAGNLQEKAGELGDKATELWEDGTQRVEEIAADAKGRVDDITHHNK